MVEVLMITKVFYPSIGGTEKYVFEISSRLAKEGHSVRIVAPQVSVGMRANSKTECMDGVFIHRFQIYRYKNWGFSPGMLSFIRKTPFDIAHFHTFSVLCRFLRFSLKNKPYFITTHGYDIAENVEKVGASARALVGYRISARVQKDNFRSSNGVFCVSMKDREKVLRLIGDDEDLNKNIFYLPVGVDLKKFSTLNKVNLKKKYKLDNKLVISEIAQFRHRKGQHIFVAAIKKIINRIPEDCVFILAGYVSDRSYFSAVQRRVKELSLEKNVMILPNASDEEILEIYGLTDIFVLPTKAEGLPLTLLEAWASKTSVIISAVGGIPYVVNNYRDVILVSPNYRDLSDKIILLINDKNLRKHLASNGYEQVKHKFSWERIIKILLEKYESALKA